MQFLEIFGQKKVGALPLWIGVPYLGNAGSANASELNFTNYSSFHAKKGNLRYFNDFSTTLTYLWDVSDLDAPTLQNVYASTETVPDHNQYIRASRVFQSNYQVSTTSTFGQAGCSSLTTRSVQPVHLGKPGVPV